MSNPKCFFSDLDAEITTLGNYDGSAFYTKEFGKYWITSPAFDSYEGKLSDKEKFLCLQETIKLNREGLIPFWVISGPEERIENSKVVKRSIDLIKEKKISHNEKGINLLRLIASKLEEALDPFSFVEITTSDCYLVGIFNDNEIFHWLSFLRESSLIHFEKLTEIVYQDRNKDIRNQQLLTQKVKAEACTGLTVQGWSKIQKLESGKNSKNVFVAMAFTDNAGNEVDPRLRECIKGVLSKLEWHSIIVDEVHHNDGIMDKVIASIKGSKFVIAELTHQKSGVYYEAGYAKGIGLQVIHIVQSDELTKCHFDVKHLNLITWKDYKDLAEKLENRIKATIV